MLINKLVHKLTPLSFRFNLEYLFAAQKKAAKPKGQKAPAKQAAKPDAKGGKQKAAKGAKQSEKAEKKQQPKITSLSFASKTRSGAFYRRAISNVNVRKSTARGNFTDQSLRSIIDTANRKDLDMIYQAYFNYLGHYTHIQNRTVDTLIIKTVSFANKDQTLLENAYKKVFQVMKNHEYLGYFPHYNATLKAAQIAKKAGKFPQFLNLLSEKLLIKVNTDVIKGLLTLASTWKDFNRLTRILMQRSHYNILTNIANQQLLEYIRQGVKSVENTQQHRKKQWLKDYQRNLNNPKPKPTQQIAKVQSQATQTQHVGEQQKQESKQASNQ